MAEKSGPMSSDEIRKHVTVKKIATAKGGLGGASKFGKLERRTKRVSTRWGGGGRRR